MLSEITSVCCNEEERPVTRGFSLSPLCKSVFAYTASSTRLSRPSFLERCECSSLKVSQLFPGLGWTTSFFSRAACRKAASAVCFVSSTLQIQQIRQYRA